MVGPDDPGAERQDSLDGVFASWHHAHRVHLPVSVDCTVFTWWSHATSSPSGNDQSWTVLSSPRRNKWLAPQNVGMDRWREEVALTAIASFSTHEVKRVDRFDAFSGGLADRARGTSE